jgi:NAD(P)-dependent dehydrogenase (short-subunit alcohol dehydrogenase family)
VGVDGPERDALLAGRVAVVTGGAGGIGAACVRLMAQHGARVVVADLPDRGARELAAAVPGDAAVAFEGDIARDDDVACMVDLARSRWGALHTLVNVAAVTGAALVDDTDLLRTPLDTFDRVLDVNLRGTALCCRHAIAAMLEQGDGGSIVNISSNAAVGGGRTLVAYSASKAALNSLTQHIAVAFGKQGIRCNAIMPGIITGTGSMGWVADPERYLAQAERNVATPRLGTPDDVAQLTLFLAADRLSGYVTGQVVSCDGGASARR